MKTLTLICALVLAVAAPAAASSTKRIAVKPKGVAEWTTKRTFGPNEIVGIYVYVNGREIPDATYRGERGLVWRGSGALVEARTAKGRGPIRFRVANFRARKAAVVRLRLDYAVV